MVPLELLLTSQLFLSEIQMNLHQILIRSSHPLLVQFTDPKISQRLKKKLDDITDLAAIEIVAEEVMDEILEDAELEELGMDIPDDAENEIVEGSGLPQIDFGSITEVTY